LCYYENCYIIEADETRGARVNFGNKKPKEQEKRRLFCRDKPRFKKNTNVTQRQKRAQTAKA
jgi:hypothetical protein